MTPEQKLNLAQQLYHSARQLKEAGLRMQHPDWNETQVQQALREAFLYGRT
ncbi:MAG: hypothetical protein IID32_06260 [Planctomycetes bacterium]|nr:hypothetical protein [Planctomycetota bacterium]